MIKRTEIISTIKALIYVNICGNRLDPDYRSRVEDLVKRLESDEVIKSSKDDAYEFHGNGD